MAKAQGKPKFGAGHLKAMGRQGLAELRGAFYAQSNVAQPTQPGIFGAPTQGEVANERRQDARDNSDTKESVVNDRLDQVEASLENEPEMGAPEIEPPEPDRE